MEMAQHGLLIGKPNSSKTTAYDALKLILSVDGLDRYPVIDRSDIRYGHCMDEQGQPIEVRLTAVLADTSQQNMQRFQDHLRLWDNTKKNLVDMDAQALAGEGGKLQLVLPVTFIAKYDKLRIPRRLRVSIEKFDLVSCF